MDTPKGEMSKKRTGTNFDDRNLPDFRVVEGIMSHVSGGVGGEAVDKAQELIYQAWESPDPAERVDLAKRALQISADCADAWVLLAEESAGGLAKALKYFRNGVAAGERALGPEAFEEYMGCFWGVLETRPYMRASEGLAYCLWAEGERKSAIERLQLMLKLNPNDNQGVRHVLLGFLMEERREAEAEALIQQYSEDWSACWKYARALLAYRREQDSESSREFRRLAIETNKHVPAYLSGKRKLPRYQPDYVGLGDKNEAIAYVFDNRKAWLDTPGAIPWLLKGKR